MSRGHTCSLRCLVNGVVVAAAVAILAAGVPTARAGNSRVSIPAGVSIDAEGILAEPDVQVQKDLRMQRAKLAKEVPGDLQQFSKLRRVSLRRLEEALAAQARNPDQPLPEEVRFLGGLLQVQYIFIYPEQNDIVLAGPAEGWKIDQVASEVGLTTDRPIMLLDDLMVALRAARAARQGGMGCSIDPTPEGLQRLQTFAKGLTRIGDPAATSKQIEQALGPQVISIGGVPATSHFARVMVAADYRMKRLAMNFEPAPVPNMPSFLHLMKTDKTGVQNNMPRWWLTPTAEPILADPDGQSWEIRGLAVKCIAEEDFLKQDGTRVVTGGKASAAGQRWADLFTANYEAISKKQSVFGQLRNVMELAVVATLIDKENLFDRVQLEPRYLLGEAPTQLLNAPRRVDSKVTLIKKGRGWLISASGGVQMYPARLAENTEAKPLGSNRDSAPAGTGWWWD